MLSIDRVKILDISSPTSLSPVKDIQHFIQLNIFLDKKIQSLSKVIQMLEMNHDLTIAYLLSKFYTIGHCFFPLLTLKSFQQCFATEHNRTNPFHNQLTAQG